MCRINSTCPSRGQKETCFTKNKEKWLVINNRQLPFTEYLLRAKRPILVVRRVEMEWDQENFARTPFREDSMFGRSLGRLLSGWGGKTKTPEEFIYI